MQTARTLFLALLLALPCAALAQDRPTREDEAVGRLSEQITRILTTQRATEYRLAEDGALVVNNERWILNWEGIGRKRKAQMIKTNGVASKPRKK